MKSNEEKVKYIEDRLDQYCVSNGSMNDRFVMSAFAYAIRQEAINEMNSRFKEYLEKKKMENGIDLEPASEIIYEIINELFGE